MDIIRVKISSFAAKIAVAKESSLKGKPFVVSSGSGRSAVLDCSFEAASEGIKKGMTLQQAKKLLPTLRTVYPEPELYKKADNIITSVSGKFSPSIELGSYGSVYIDISGTGKLWGKPIDAASKIVMEIKRTAALEASVGTASSKCVSDIASKIAKPYGIISVHNGSEREFLSNQPVYLMEGIGTVFYERLRCAGITTIGDIAAIPESYCNKLMGTHGKRIREKALGIDNEPVFSDTKKLSSLKSSIILENDTESLEKSMMVLLKICEDVGIRMRELDLSTKKIFLTVCFSDGLLKSGTRESIYPLWSDSEIFSAASVALEKIKNEKRTKVRSLTLELFKLSTDHYQTSLFLPVNNKKHLFLQETIDHLKKKFGNDSIRAAFALKAPK